MANKQSSGQVWCCIATSRSRRHLNRKFDKLTPLENLFQKIGHAKTYLQKWAMGIFCAGILIMNENGQKNPTIFIFIFFFFSKTESEL